MYPPEVSSGLEWKTVRPHEEANSTLSGSVIPDYKLYNKYDSKQMMLMLNRNLTFIFWK